MYWSKCEVCGREIPVGEACYGLSNGGSVCGQCCTGPENGAGEKERLHRCLAAAGTYTRQQLLILRELDRVEAAMEKIRMILEEDEG